METFFVTVLFLLSLSALFIADATSIKKQADEYEYEVECLKKQIRNLTRHFKALEKHLKIRSVFRMPVSESIYYESVPTKKGVTTK